MMFGGWWIWIRGAYDPLQWGLLLSMSFTAPMGFGQLVEVGVSQSSNGEASRRRRRIRSPTSHPHGRFSHGCVAQLFDLQPCQSPLRKKRNNFRLVTHLWQLDYSHFEIFWVFLGLDGSWFPTSKSGRTPPTPPWVRRNPWRLEMERRIAGISGMKISKPRVCCGKYDPFSSMIYRSRKRWFSIAMIVYQRVQNGYSIFLQI